MLGHLLFASTPSKEDPHEGMSDMQKLSAQYSVCTFVSHLRDSQILCSLWLSRATIPVTWKNPRLIQTVVAVQFHCGSKTGKLPGRRLYIPDTKSRIFSGKNIGNWLGILSKWHARGLHCFLSNLSFFFFFNRNLRGNNDPTRNNWDIHWKEFLVTIVLYISELDIKQQMDRAASGKFLPGVLHR